MKLTINQILQQGITVHQKGNFKEAELLYRSILQTEPNHPESNYYLGLLQNRTGRLDEAEVSLKKAIENNADYAQAHANLGVTLDKLDRLEEAVESYRKAIELKFEDANCYYNLGIILNKLGRFNEAEASYKKAIELKPDYASVHNNLGVLLIKLSKFNEAEVCLKKAMELKPDNAGIYHNLGNVKKELGRLDEAISNYEQASYLEPANPKYHNMRGYTPSLLVRQLLFKNEDITESINKGDWEDSEVLLQDICNGNFKYINEYANEFIELWCQYCYKLLKQGDFKKFTPIFIKLLFRTERNKDLNNLIKFLFEDVDINTILELVEPDNKILIKVSYCQYKFLTEDFLISEELAYSNIQEATNLIESFETEDLGWLIIRRSLALFKHKDFARKTLNDFMTNLVD